MKFESSLFWVLRKVGSRLSPSGFQGRLAILNYHRVLKEPDPMRPGDVDQIRFEWQMELISHQFNVLPLSEAVVMLRNGTLPERALSITFDDGYADNVHHGLPILVRLRLPATFFIASAYLDGGWMWNDTIIEAVRRAALPTLDLESLGMGVRSLRLVEDRVQLCAELIRRYKYESARRREQLAEQIQQIAGAGSQIPIMMNPQQVNMLVDAGMEIGGHTRTHPILGRLSDTEAAREIMDGKSDLENIIGRSIDIFAYPNGKPGIDYNISNIAAVRRAGFTAAVSTQWGAAHCGDHLYQLPRFTPWDRNPLRFNLRLMRNYRIHS